ncbi:MAG: hypothetical protein MUF65_10940 [Rubritepida sp.]|jgi:hypothetical protein|nr:hypothetical protein [Rubritepida sp.]MCU0945870.1 hypothetical protein [Rubritepida sp.]
MAILIGALLFALPFLLYLAWWRLSGSGPAGPLPLVALGLGALGLVIALGAALVFGLSRGIEPGDRYVPARIEGGEIRR